MVEIRDGYDYYRIGDVLFRQDDNGGWQRWDMDGKKCWTSVGRISRSHEEVMVRFKPENDGDEALHTSDTDTRHDLTLSLEMDGVGPMIKGCLVCLAKLGLDEPIMLIEDGDPVQYKLKIERVGPVFKEGFYRKGNVLYSYSELEKKWRRWDAVKGEWELLVFTQFFPGSKFYEGLERMV